MPRGAWTHAAADVNYVHGHLGSSPGLRGLASIQSVGSHRGKPPTLRGRMAITPAKTREFYAMPGWWITMVLVSAVLTGLGIGEVQQRLFPGILLLLPGLGMTMGAFYLWWRARRQR